MDKIRKHNMLLQFLIYGEALKIKSPHWIKVCFKQEVLQAVGICSQVLKYIFDYYCLVKDGSRFVICLHIYETKCFRCHLFVVQGSQCPLQQGLSCMC